MSRRGQQGVARTHRVGTLARRRRAGEAGFTLIELTVSLIAGLIVAMGIVTLSKSSTQTFHEEMRSSAAEANLRTAADRLRADLGRAGFMSTPNIASDPVIAKPLNIAGDPAPAAFNGLRSLASIQLTTGGSVTNNGLPLSGTNGLTPDLIRIGGNMTTTDLYPAHLQPAGGGGGCQRIDLDANSPALYRLIGASAQAAQDFNNAFQPAPNGVFMIRVVDAALRTQYVATCPGMTSALVGGPGAWVASIYVAAGTPVLTSDVIPTSVITPITQIWVNPVQIVQWEIMPATAEPAAYGASPLAGQPLTPAIADPAKYDLVRSFVDAQSGNVLPGTSEIVAEYAVDLRFSFSVETGTAVLPQIVTYSFDDDADNALWAQDVFVQPFPAIQGPQRIRSVSARLATRASQADRTLNIAAPTIGGTLPSFLYRYCVVGAGCDPTNTAGALQYARMRTMTTEVSMPNQSTSFY
jgi:type II secretory pathway pseudopilin PulG